MHCWRLQRTACSHRAACPPPQLGRTAYDLAVQNYNPAFPGLVALLQFDEAGELLMQIQNGNVPPAALVAHGASEYVAEKLALLLRDPVTVGNLYQSEVDDALAAVAAFCPAWGRWRRRGRFLDTLRRAWQQHEVATELAAADADGTRAASLLGLLKLRRLCRTRGGWEAVEPFGRAVAVYL